jgi:hypothetical protein
LMGWLGFSAVRSEQVLAGPDRVLAVEHAVFGTPRSTSPAPSALPPDDLPRNNGSPRQELSRNTQRPTDLWQMRTLASRRTAYGDACLFPEHCKVCLTCGQFLEITCRHRRCGMQIRRARDLRAGATLRDQLRGSSLDATGAIFCDDREMPPTPRRVRFMTPKSMSCCRSSSVSSRKRMSAPRIPRLRR